MYLVDEQSCSVPTSLLIEVSSDKGCQTEPDLQTQLLPTLVCVD